MQQRTTRTTPSRTAVLIVLGALALSACGDDAEGETAATTATTESSETTEPPAPTTAAEAEPSVLTVEMADFRYDGLPDEVPAGTRIEVTNASDAEIHEFVAMRLADDDDRLMSAIVGDLEALLTSGPPAAVLLAPPGGDQIAAVGDGTLAEPGRYVIVCVIPTGADPAEYLAAAAENDGPPQVDGGPPHVMNGMYAELTVTG